MATSAAIRPARPASTSPSRSRRRSPSAPSPWCWTACSPISPIRSRRDATIKFVARTDPEALELIRHDAAHVLRRGRAGAVARHAGDHRPGDRARLVLRLRQGGAVHAGGSAARSKRRCTRSSRRNAPFTKEVWSRDKAKAHLQGQGRDLQDRAGRRDPRRRGLQDLQAGRVARSLPRPAHDRDRAHRQGVQGRSLLRQPIGAATAQGPKLQRIYGLAFAKEEELAAYLKQREEAEKRDHRKLGREMDLFHFQEEGPGVVFWHAKGWTTFQQLIAYMRRRLADDYQEVQGAAAARQVAVGDLRPLGLVLRQHVRGEIGDRLQQPEGRGGRAARVRAEADELPGPRADLQARPEELSRSADAARRVRLRAPLRGRRARCTG